jgi:hypothetical protein
MVITREALEQHKAQLESERLQHLNMAHAVDGAIQDCEFWLGELAKEADAKPEIKISK